MDTFKENININNEQVCCFVNSSNIQHSLVAHPHWHDAIEILYVEEGNAKQQIDQSFFNISQGDIVVIWSNQIHSTYSYKNEVCRIRVIQFMPDDLKLMLKIGFDKALNKSNALWVELRAIISDIAQEHEQKDIGYEYAVKACIYKFYTYILRNMTCLPVIETRNFPNKEIVIKIFDYIDNNYMNTINLNDAAAQVHLSASHFMRVFKQATGMTFKYYLNFYRINKASVLIKDGCPVTKTAMDCGFENINTFIRLFKHFKKCVPSKYKCEN